MNKELISSKELAELRRDKARLDWLSSNREVMFSLPDDVVGWSGTEGDDPPETLRELIDEWLEAEQ